MKCVGNQLDLSPTPEGPLAPHIGSFAGIHQRPGSPTQGKSGRFIQPDDRLLSFLNSL